MAYYDPATSPYYSTNGGQNVALPIPTLPMANSDPMMQDSIMADEWNAFKQRPDYAQLLAEAQAFIDSRPDIFQRQYSDFGVTPEMMSSADFAGLEDQFAHATSGNVVGQFQMPDGSINDLYEGQIAPHGSFDPYAALNDPFGMFSRYSMGDYQPQYNLGSTYTPTAGIGGLPGGSIGGTGGGGALPGTSGGGFGSPTGGTSGGATTGGTGTTQSPAGTYGGLGTTSGSYGTNLSNNPYLTGMADDISRRTQQMLGQNNNAIAGQAIGVGGLGGSRQGVAQGLAASRAADTLQGNLANLYGGAWNNQANRDLSRYGLDQNFYTAQRGQDLAGAGLGANIYTQGVQGGWIPIQNAANAYSNFTGFGNTTSTTDSGGGTSGLIGGLLSGATLGKNMGWW